MLSRRNGEADKVASDQVELSLTESFAKHKRNVLLVCSAIVILAVAGSDKVKIPFSGTEEGVPAAVAYFLLGAALIYFFSTFWIELLAVQARNLDATAGDGGGFGERLTTALRSVVSEAERVKGLIESIKGQHDRYCEAVGNVELPEILEKSRLMATEVEQEIKSIRVNVLKDDFTGMTLPQIDIMIKAMNDLSANITITTANIFRIKKSGDEIISGISSNQKSSLELLSSIESDIRTLTLKFEKISSRISRSQRIGFSALERAIPVSFFLVSILICADGVVFSSYYTQKLRDQVPAIAEAQKLDAQTGNHINGKP